MGGGGKAPKVLVLPARHDVGGQAILVTCHALAASVIPIGGREVFRIGGMTQFNLPELPPLGDDGCLDLSAMDKVQG